MSVDTLYLRTVPTIATRDNVVLLVAAVAALAGPLGAVLVARLQFQWNFKAKERVRWIETLRDRVCEFLVEATELAAIPDNERDTEPYFTQQSRAFRAATFAIAMLYDSDPDLKVLSDSLGEVAMLVDAQQSPLQATLTTALEPVGKNLEAVLKGEWEKAKRGK